MNGEQRREFLHKLLSSVRTQEFPYDKRPPRKINWRSYDVAQAHEMADIIDLIRASVDVASARLEARRIKRVRRGPPGVPVEEVVKVLLLQSYLGVPNRVAEGLTYLFGHSLGLSGSFSYKTIERGYDRRRVEALLD